MRRAIALCASLVIGAGILTADPAAAAPNDHLITAVSGSELGGVDLEAALVELRAAGLVTAERLTPDGNVATVSLSGALSFDVVTSPRAHRLSGGYDAGGRFVKFNQYDQNLLLNGAGFALGTAICLIPAVGQLACIAVQAIIAVGSAAVSAMKGTCKNNKQLKVYFSNNHASKGGCV